MAACLGITDSLGRSGREGRRVGSGANVFRLLSVHVVLLPYVCTLSLTSCLAFILTHLISSLPPSSSLPERWSSLASPRNVGTFLRSSLGPLVIFISGRRRGRVRREGGKGEEGKKREGRRKGWSRSRKTMEGTREGGREGRSKGGTVNGGVT